MILRYLSVVAVILSMGCADKNPTPIQDTPSVANKDRPPLQVWLVDAPELEKEIGVRWQSASDQPMEVKVMTASELTDGRTYSADVVVFPGSQIGDMVRHGVIGRLPSPLLKKKDSNRGEIVEEWPVRWRNLASFGSQWYGIPLGAPPLGAIALGTELHGLVEIEKSLISTKLSTTTSMIEWDKFLNSAESTLAKGGGGSSTIDEQISKLSAKEKGNLVDRFLWIAATTDARRKGLFDLVKMQARMHQPEFVASAKILRRLALAFPETIFDEPIEAWSKVVNHSSGKVMFAIGRPSPTYEIGGSPVASETAPIVVPLIWNAEHGLIASVGKNTRQSAVSSLFLSWLTSEELREVLRPTSPRMELLPSQSDRNATRADYREFQNLNSRQHLNQGMDLSLRFANGSQYRDLLADYLAQVIQGKEQAETVMIRCSKAWNALTDKLDKDKQRLSIEQSLGFQKQ
ncbi:MAG: hypothetical protein ABL921_00805 [Pirellula sp.]